MKILIVGEHSSFLNEAFLRMVCEKMGVSVEFIEKKKSQHKDILEIIQELSLLKPPQIPILEILPFLEEQTKEEKKGIFFDECFNFISFVGQPKTVRIRSPCKTGIFYSSNKWDSFRLNCLLFL